MRIWFISEKCGVGGEFTHSPRDDGPIRNHVGKRRRQAEHRIFLGDGANNAVRGGTTKGIKLACQRKHQIVAAAENRADAIVGSLRIEFKSFRGAQERSVINVRSQPRTASAYQDPRCFGAALRRKMRRSKELFHFAELFVGSRHQADSQWPFGLLAQLPGIQSGKSLFELTQDSDGHGRLVTFRPTAEHHLYTSPPF